LQPEAISECAPTVNGNAKKWIRRTGHERKQETAILTLQPLAVSL
jgi:hypothetical protein